MQLVPADAVAALGSRSVIDLDELYARHAQRFDAARTRSLMELPYLEKATTWR
jgi:hypothetical protein